MHCLNLIDNDCLSYIEYKGFDNCTDNFTSIKIFQIKIENHNDYTRWIYGHVQLTIWIHVYTQVVKTGAGNRTF